MYVTSAKLTYLLPRTNWGLFSGPRVNTRYFNFVSYILYKAWIWYSFCINFRCKFI